MQVLSLKVYGSCLSLISSPPLSLELASIDIAGDVDLNKDTIVSLLSSNLRRCDPLFRTFGPRTLRGGKKGASEEFYGDVLKQLRLSVQQLVAHAYLIGEECPLLFLAVRRKDVGITIVYEEFSFGLFKELCSRLRGSDVDIWDREFFVPLEMSRLGKNIGHIHSLNSEYKNHGARYLASQSVKITKILQKISGMRVAIMPSYV